MKKLLALSLAMLMLFATMAGCQSPKKAETSAPPASAKPVEEAKMVNGLKDANGDGKIVIAEIHKFGDALWFITESKAIEAKVKEMGADEHMYLDAKDDGNLYLQMIDTVIAQGVDGVITTPPDQTLSQVAVEKLTAAGIPVLASDD
ncbi:MAG: substrate-binding domain-containing protein, partial [Oscillospiraceae bacterium]